MDTLEARTNILITGVTGLIGGEILRRLPRRVTDGDILALVRPSRGTTISQRIVDRLIRSGERGFYPGNVFPVAGDIQKPDWGLDHEDLQHVLDSVDMIIHVAADTSFAAHHNPARTNVDSVHHLLDLAARCRRRPLIVYMSSAANCGNVHGACLGEDDGCRPDNDHFNEYTQSKAVGEQLICDSGLPFVVFRPTIVLSAGLPDDVFARQILWCAPLTRAFEALPLNAAAHLDMVDVAFVAEAAIRLLEKPGRSHDCYHLSAGPAASVTVGKLFAIADVFYSRRHPLRLIPPQMWRRAERLFFVRTRLQKMLYRKLGHYFPFLNMDVTYDNQRLKDELGADLPRITPIHQYFGKLLSLIETQAAMREAA